MNLSEPEIQSDEDTKFQTNDDRRVIRKVIENSEMESSSDLICALAAIGNQTKNFLKHITDPLIPIEFPNWRDDWSGNIMHSYKHMNLLDDVSLVIVKKAYEDLLSYYLNDELMNVLFPMDKKDHVGWKIYKEIDEKRLAAIKIQKLRDISG